MATHCDIVMDKQTMIDKGHSKNLPLYLKHDKGGYYVSNWPGTLRFDCLIRKGRHNIAGTRHDVWFDGPDGYVWHGTQYGEWTEICHCRRTQRKVD